MTKPTLIDKRYSNYTSDILKTFENDKPLSADQINFLAGHEKILSSYAMDPVIKYYLKGYRDKARKELTFTLSKQEITCLTAQRIKHYLQTLLKNNLAPIDLEMTLDQFQHFKTIGINQLIFWHGNQFLTNDSLQPEGIPYLIYVQWGNLFGVVKLELEERIIKGNVHIYFEDMKIRTLYQCIKDYSHLMNLELRQQNKMGDAKGEEETLIHKPSLTLTPFFHEIH